MSRIKYCRTCGSEVDHVSLKCLRDRTHYTVGFDAIPVQPEQKCPNCKDQVLIKRMYCESCGFKIFETEYWKKSYKEILA